MTQRTRADSPTKTCTMPDCARPLRARGQCSYHYNRARPESHHPKVTVPCTVCATPVVRRADSGYSPTCSVVCRSAVQFGDNVATAAYDWRVDVVRRVRKAGCVVVEQFDREDIFERDDWTCYLCGIQCTQPDPFVPTSATVDHVVPLSGRGEHSRANVRTCCLSCNSRKRG